MPGSETLCSVHSGHERLMRRRASETRSWKRRSSSWMSGSLVTRALLVLALVGDDVERIDEVALVVGRADPVADVDQQLAVDHPREVEVDLLDLDARLPAIERAAHLGLEPARRRGVDRVEHEVVDAAAELRPHRPLAGRGAEDDLDRLVHIRLARREGDAAAPVDREGEREPRAEKFRHRFPNLSDVDDSAGDLHGATR